MREYAATTSVSVDKTRLDITELIRKHGAQNIGHMETNDGIHLVFDLADRRIRYFMPTPDAYDFRKTPTGKNRTAEQVSKAVDQANRSRWRALLLIIKAKLEGIAIGVSTVEQEFLSNIVMPSGKLVASEVVPRIADAYKSGGPVALLPAPGER